MLKLYKKKFLMILVLLFFAVALFFVFFRSVKIIDIHQRSNTSIVLVKYYPLTDKGKIEWWLKHKNMLKTKYNIPVADADGRYKVILWGFGDGYKEEGKYDRLCFDDMKPPQNCVDKNALMIVNNDKGDITDFSAGEDVYVLQENGLIVKINRKW